MRLLPVYGFAFALLAVACVGCDSAKSTSQDEPIERKEQVALIETDNTTSRRGGTYFQRVDDDGDGKLSKSEMPKEMSDALDLIDTDEDGFILEEEWNAYLQQSSQRNRTISKADKAAVLSMLKRVGGRYEGTGSDFGQDDVIVRVMLENTTATNEDVELLTKVPDLFEVQLASKGLDDECLTCLADIAGLGALRLGGDQFSDEGMQHVSSLRQLRRIELNNTDLGPAGLVALSKVPNLEILLLKNQELGSERLEALREFRRVYEIRISECEVSEAELSDLRRALPDCEIVIEQQEEGD